MTILVLAQKAASSQMSAEVLAALIAAGAAVVVAVLQFFLSMRMGREIELLKGQLARKQDNESEYLKDYLQRYAEGREQSIEAFRDYLTAVQELKDRCRRVAESPRSFASDTLVRETGELTTAVSRALGNAQVHISPSDYETAHALKHGLFRLASATTEWHSEAVRRRRTAEIADPNELEHLLHMMNDAREYVDTQQKVIRLRAREAAADYVKQIQEGSREPVQSAWQVR